MGWMGLKLTVNIIDELSLLHLSRVRFVNENLSIDIKFNPIRFLDLLPVTAENPHKCDKGKDSQYLFT
jgi:hypothetical protein